VFLDRLTQAMGERSKDLATGQRWYETGPVGLLMKLKKKKPVETAITH
jgi:glycine betaine/proline transport system permease protein